VILLLLGYCSVPFASVVSAQLHLTTQDHVKITENAEAFFLDENGNIIVKRASGYIGSFNNVLTWVVHSKPPNKSDGLTVDKARKVVKVKLMAKGCAIKIIPIVFISEYDKFSPMPHGGGPAYMYHHAKQTIMLDCAGVKLHE
jgi:hypothetical protein